MAHHQPMLVRFVLGTCVAVTLYDTRQGFGGANVFLWPQPGRKDRSTATFGNVAVPGLARIMHRMGSRRRFLEAQILGGGTPPERFGEPRRWWRSEKDLGADNVRAARAMLKRLRIPVVSEDVGGCKGRKIIYNTQSNETVIIKVDSIRDTDWLRYGEPVAWDRL
jgi:chemotaxis protein CheD